MRFPIWRKNKITVRTFNNQKGDSEVALLSFNGKIRNQIIESFNNQFLVEGEHIKNGGKSSPKTILSLIGAGAGSLGIAAQTSGQLFMATANPATLMAVGNGVGSAVMGASGIVAQAPFIAVAGSLMPVVAPLIVFQMLTTITILNQFKTVNKKLEDIQNTLYRIIKRDEATFIGEIISASNRISDLESQFSHCNQFSNDMIVRLALLEDKVNPIIERYNYLYQSQKIILNMSREDLKFKQADAFLAIIASIVDIRIDLLRMKLNIQENPKIVEKSAQVFKSKIAFYNDLWVSIQNNGEDIKDISKDMIQAIEGMNWWQQQMPDWLLGKRKERKELERDSKYLEDASMKHQKEFDEKVEAAIRFADTINKGLESANKMNLIYWQDENGEHSYYTDDLMIQ